MSFCRVLALLLFEPEERQMMESTRTLKSVELLSVRRNRMARPDTPIDRNQALVLGHAGLVPRLVK